MNSSLPPALRNWVEIGLMLADGVASESMQALAELRPKRHGVYLTRRPGVETPCWNRVVTLIRAELSPPGAKARMARYLGIPRQRLTEYLSSRKRLPDAEVTLQMLHWLVHKRAGRDLSL